MSNNTLEEINVIYEDNDIVAVNKPAGLMVHPDGRAKGPFLTDWIVEHYPETNNVGEPARGQNGEDLNRSGIVHRLDTETSGAILVAKTHKGFQCLKKQFQDRTIKKKYLAFVWGDIKEEFGTIKLPIGRSNSDFRKKSAQRGARGELRQAETYWTRIANISLGEKFSLIEAEPKTGRTHQIRVHLSATNHPVVGDKLYAPKRELALGFTRTARHSRSIEFDNCERKRVKIEAPLPKDFEEVMKKIGKV